MTRLLLTIALLPSPSVLPHVDLREVIAKTGAMLPGIPINSRLMVDESFYAAKNPRRFDIVVVRHSFRTNPDDPVEKSMDVVSRVIGLPGETIALRGGSVYINGRRIKEPFAIRQFPKTVDESFPCGEMSMLKIPVGEYFLLADNRPESEDSRLWTPQTIPKSNVLGKVVTVVIPSTAIQQALGADSPVNGLYSKLRGRAAQAQRYALRELRVRLGEKSETNAPTKSGE